MADVGIGPWGDEPTFHAPSMQSSDQLLGSMMNSDRVCESGRRRTTPFGRSARTIVPRADRFGHRARRLQRRASGAGTAREQLSRSGVTAGRPGQPTGFRPSPGSPAGSMPRAMASPAAGARSGTRAPWPYDECRTEIVARPVVKSDGRPQDGAMNQSPGSDPIVMATR